MVDGGLVIGTNGRLTITEKAIVGIKTSGNTRAIIQVVKLPSNAKGVGVFKYWK